ncbi:MAG: InlB B-repeat-containing protein [Clostridia bacterium]|nr:InlB B-repeat-containing protein [Clostridia bacterium]
MSKRAKKLGTRILSIALLVCMLVTQFAFIPTTFAASVQSTELQMNTYSSDLYIYNYLCYTDGTGTVRTNSSGGMFVIQGSSSFDIHIGDVKDAEGDKRPMDSDIDVELSGLSMAPDKKLIVSPINGGKRELDVTVRSSPTIPTLVIEDKAKVTITLYSNVTIDLITLGEGSSLEINTNGHTADVDTVSGYGDLTVSGNGHLSTESVSAENIILNAATVQGGGDSSVTANKTITVNGATVKDISLFGFNSSATGRKSITFNGGNFDNVSTVGVDKASNAVVTVSGLGGIVSSKSTRYVFDYLITYKAADTVLTPLDTWPTSYRVEHESPTDTSTEVLGYVANGIFTSSDSVVLPGYDVDAFYGYAGWLLNDTPITELAVTQNGDVTLIAELDPYTVTVDMDLGYTPDSSTNDAPIPPKNHTTTVETNGTITLDEPERFGYVFKGWKIISGTRHDIVDGSYTVNTEDLDKVGDTETFILKMEAQWEEDSFPVRFILTSTVRENDIEISVNGGVNWLKLSNFISLLPDTIPYENGIFSPKEFINYGETLDEYVKRIFGGEVLIKDTTGIYTFTGWMLTDTATPVSPDEEYRYGDGFLIMPDTISTLDDWKTALKKNPISFSTIWRETDHKYTLTVQSRGEWTVLIDGTSNASTQIEVSVGSTVTLSCDIDVAKTSITHWSIPASAGKVTERGKPDSNGNVFYDFIMPDEDININLSSVNTSESTDPITVDLAISDIEFATGVKYNERTHSGFWYDVDADDMTPLYYDDVKGAYFYIWNPDESFFVTTNNVPTKNQLTIVQQMNGGVHLTKCIMEKRDEYVEDAVGRYLNGTKMERNKYTIDTVLMTIDMRGYGNIVIDYSINNSYVTDIIVHGSNTIAAIFPDKINNQFTPTLRITGEDNGQLTLDHITNVGVLRVNNLIVNEYSGSTYEYLIYNVAGQLGAADVYFKDTNLYARNKRLYLPNGQFGFNTSEYAVEMDVGSAFVGYEYVTNGSKNTYMRIRGDLFFFFFNLELSGKTSLVVDGMIHTHRIEDSYGDADININGYVIVKGLGLIGTQLNVKNANSVVIANMVTANKGSNFEKGTIIANQLLNPPVKVPSLSGVDYTVNAYTSKASDSTYPFFNVSNDRKETSQYLFNGVRMFLFGYYRDSGKANVYDVTSNLKDDNNNPVKAILDPLLDANGDLKKELRNAPDKNAVYNSAKKAIEDSITAKTYTNKECVQIGDATHTAETVYPKSVKISGGEIYAAGNITFFNETTVTGGTVVCGGTFSSKRDVVISGGNITANEVGIADAITVSENGALRYATLTLKGGNINTNHIGALTKGINNVDARGVLVLDNIGAALTPRTEAAVTVKTYIYVNYLYDKNVYNVDGVNPTDLCFTSTYSGGVINTLTQSGNVNLINPVIKSNSEAAMWLYNDANGEKIGSINVYGYVNGDSSKGIVFDGQLSISLYAAKANYNLTISSDYNSGFTVSFGENTLNANESASVPVRSQVTVKLENDILYGETVIRYKDAAGVIHNILKASGSTSDPYTNTYTFSMPFADVEIFVMSEYIHNLDESSISFTNTGFAVEEYSAARRQDSVFEYYGNIRITQTTPAKATNNRIVFETADSGNVTRGIKITLTDVNQSTLGVLAGIELADGAIVDITVSNSNATKRTVIAPILVPQNSSFTIKGVDKDRLHFGTGKTGVGAVAGSFSGKSGNISYKNLNLTVTNDAATRCVFGYSVSKTTAQLLFEDCIITDNSNYSSDTLGLNMGSVVIRNCEMTVSTSSDVGGRIFLNCGDVSYINTVVNHTFGGARGSVPTFNHNDNATIYLKDSTFTIKYIRQDTQSNKESIEFRGNLVVSGNSVINSTERIMLKSIKLSDNAKFISEDGYLLCPDVTVSDNAEIDVGYLIISGFVKSSYDTEAKLFDAMAGGSDDAVLNGASYQGLIINGGTVNASVIGGAKNAKITVNGGTVNTSALGTLGEYYGYWVKIPPKSENVFMYTYSVIPENMGATVNVNGGTVNVADGGYLGGMFSTVNITDGEISLGNGAVLGVSEAQKTLMYNNATSKGQPLTNAVTVNASGGQIEGDTVNTPYGSTVISGTASVKVDNLTAANGSITVTTSDLSYENPYTGADEDDMYAGVVINDTLDGLNVLIDNKAVVYANNAYTTADLGKNGMLKVSNKAHLYIGTEHGSRGNGTAEVIIVTDGYIYGNKIYYITYVLMDDDIDKAENSGSNWIEYNWGEYNIDLYDPTRPGYDFAGWYGTEDYSDERVTSIAANAARNITLYAKWTPKTVKVVIKINAAEVGMSAGTLEAETVGLGTISGNVFTYVRTANVSYRDKILGEGNGHINLANYMLATLGVKELKIEGYANQYVDGNTIITKEMLGDELVLLVTKVAKTKIKLSLDLNLVVKGEHSYSKYNNIRDFDEEDSVTLRSSYVDIGATVSSANGFVDALNKLIVPTAAGFTFGGWYTDKSFANEYKVSEDYVVSADFNGMIYAKWIANEYYIEFDAGEGNDITSDGSVPLVSDATSRLVAKITYNNRIDTAKYFFKLDNGSYVEISPEIALSVLPSAWKEGYTFNGEWHYTDNLGYERNITKNVVFNVTNINDGTSWYENTVNMGDPVSAITFLPKYARIKITYDLNGGHLVGEDWKANYDSFEEKHGRYETVIKEPNKALIGYSTTTPEIAADYDSISTVVNDHGESFYVISTSVSYFSANPNYVTNDYRGQISNKGYTFKGWRLMEEIGGGVLQPKKEEGNDVYIGCFPRYKDVIVQAVWEANTYNINLNPYDVNNKSPYAEFSHGVDDIVPVTLTVGMEIEGLDALWPSRETEALDPWFAYDATKDKNALADNDKRYLLGFTFDALDPGVNDDANTDGFAVYHKYSEDVTDLINRGCIYTHENKKTVGSIFGLPSNDDYNGNINIDGIDDTVPDYPNGSTVEMYAVYRERSLVFVEYYTDNNGDIQQKVLKAFPWTEWSEYPTTGEFRSVEERIEGYGYTLLKLGVNSKDVNASEYPKNADDYNAKVEGYKKAAQDLGTYDIMVYTIFVAQVVENAALNAGSDPLDNTSDAFEYVIPNSMQAGVLNYKVERLDANGEFTIVNSSSLNRFDNTVSDKKVAILAELYDTNGIKQDEKWLESATVNATKLFDILVGSGWVVKLTLYHSSVMKTEGAYRFKFTLGFESDDLKDQHITLNTTINMTPSLYDVEYEAVLPTDPVVENWNGFRDTSPYVLMAEDFKYGDTLTSTVPVVEGYDANGKWKTDTLKELSYGSSLIADTDAKNAVDGGTNVIRLTTEWIIKKFKLSATQELLSKWNIYYGGEQLTGTSPVEVDYRTGISFELKTQAGEYPEFAWIRIGNTDGQRVDTYGALSYGKYVFTMPADNVASYYSRLTKLYLELGSITVNAGGYSLDDEDFVWRGDYAILMDENNNTDQSETANVLTLTGDLSDREIYLGNLNITSENSVSLDDAKATLTAKYDGKESSIKAKNIRVSSTSSMIMDNGSLDLTPVSGAAGIGGISTDTRNGTITLNNVTVKLTMEPSVSSGIGPADKVSGGGNIDLNGCTVTVTEKAGIGSSYSGTWIGGNGVGSVTLDNTNVLLGDGSDMILGPKVLDGDSVTLVGCGIGTESAPLIDPIHAKNSLTITDTSIYQSFNKGTAIGTDEGGTVSVTNSNISSMVINVDALYTGKLLINDAASCVVIANTRILEAKHGDITITSSGVTQGTEYFAHTNRYLIIKEISGAANDLTVGSITNTTIITVDDADFDNVIINTDVEILLDGAIKLNKLTVADNKTATMDATSGATLVITEIDGTTSGSYEQEGGTLSGDKLGIGGNMTLTNVTASASEYIGSFGVGGVTTVTIDGGSVTSAEGTIGALGKHSETFTFVVLENTPTVNGTLAQDHYRLSYNTAFGTNDLPKVLRSVTNSGTVTYMPSVPDGPTGDTNFLFWYYLDGENKIGIGDKADGVTEYIDGLTKDEIDYAEAKDTDGTRTLKLYAWVNITIEGIVSSGNIYDEFNATANTVTIYPTGAFTAMYTVSGTVMANSSYVITLDTPFKAGTVLTLGVISDNIPSFYYYYCNGMETEIELSSFAKMGTSKEAPTLLSDAAGTALADVLVIVADFTGVNGNEDVTSHKMTLSVVVAGSTVASNDKVSYNTTFSSEIKVGEDGKVVIDHKGDTQYDGEKLYLIVNVNGKTEIPLNAYVGFDKLTHVVRLNKHSWYVEIGEAKNDVSMEITPFFEGFGAGEYVAEWILVRSTSADDNIMGNTITTQGGGFTVEQTIKEEMSIILLTVDGQRETDRTLSAGSEHIATFSYTLSSNAKMEMIGEMHTDEAGYIPVEDISLEQTDNGITAKFGRGLRAGTYRITFSIDANNTDDNVYFLFIIE